MATHKSPTKVPAQKSVEALRHTEATRKHIPTAEYQPVLREEEQRPVRVAYERRNRDLDSQLVCRGEDEQDWSDLVVHAPPLYIQEKVHPKALVDDLLRATRERRHGGGELAARQVPSRWWRDRCPTRLRPTSVDGSRDETTPLLSVA